MCVSAGAGSRSTKPHSGSVSLSVCLSLYNDGSCARAFLASRTRSSKIPRSINYKIRPRRPKSNKISFKTGEEKTFSTHPCSFAKVVACWWPGQRIRRCWVDMYSFYCWLGCVLQNVPYGRSKEYWLRKVWRPRPILNGTDVKYRQLLFNGALLFYVTRDKFSKVPVFLGLAETSWLFEGSSASFFVTEELCHII